MTRFVILSWLVSLVTTSFILLLVYKQRFQLVRPSIIFLIFFNLQIQLPSAFQARWIESFLIDPWHYFILAQVFPLLAFVVIAFQFRESALIIYRRTHISRNRMMWGKEIIVALSIVTAMVVFWYVSVVLWQQTGLYALLFDPENSLRAREESMKLLGNSALQYGFTLVSTVIVPVLAILLAFKLLRAIRSFKLMSVLACATGILALLVVVSLYGARGPAATVLMSIFYAFLLRAKFPMNPFRLAIILVVALTIPAFISLFGTGGAVSVVSVVDSYTNVLDRTFGRNILSHVWTVDFVQDYGFFGVGGIPKVAVLFGERPIYVFNVVGVAYGDSPTESANSAFVFAYYACFGLLAFLPCLLLTCLLDFVLILCRKVHTDLLIPCIAATVLAATKLTFTFYTTVLLSGGFVLIPVSCWLITMIMRGGPIGLSVQKKLAIASR